MIAWAEVYLRAPDRDPRGVSHRTTDRGRRRLGREHRRRYLCRGDEHGEDAGTKSPGGQVILQ
jgi:hypothetical protein